MYSIESISESVAGIVTRRQNYSRTNGPSDWLQPGVVHLSVLINIGSRIN
jgi:hypothetical protein